VLSLISHLLEYEHFLKQTEVLLLCCTIPLRVPYGFVYALSRHFAGTDAMEIVIAQNSVAMMLACTVAQSTGK
jgi:hypothetical protein